MGKCRLIIFFSLSIIFHLLHIKNTKKKNLKLKLYGGEPCLNKRTLTVKCFQYLSSNVNKHSKSHSLAALLKNKSHSAANAEIEVFFILAFDTSGQKLRKIRTKSFLVISNFA